jgi:hypothetical protein
MLTKRIRAIHGGGRAVAVHCVTREALFLLLAALDEAGYLRPPDAHRATPRRVAAGSPADLVLLRVPLAEALAAPSADLVAATLIDGAVVSPT